jgi:hypothetical protein
MLKLEKRQILKNVGSSWSALGINVIVGIFLSPFILHRLGDAAFGIWVLIFSVTGYYGLFDLGIRSSIIRYVSKYTATDDRERLSQFLSTALFTYTCIGAVSMVLTALLSSSVEHLFKIPPDMHTQARLLLLMVGASVSLGFPLGVFGGMLEGLQRFYILNWTSIGATLARAALIVYFLNRGYGLLTVALLTVGLPILTSILRGIIVFRLCPVPLGLEHVDRASFRHMANYGGTTFLVLVASRLRFRTDELVLGTMMSTVAVAWFNIGARIVDYAQEFVSSLAQVFVPMSSHSEATGNLDRVRKIYIAGNRVCAFLIWQAHHSHLGRSALCSAQLPSVGGNDHSVRADAVAGCVYTHLIWSGQTSDHGGDHCDRGHCQSNSQHRACAFSWNCRRCVGHRHSAQFYLHCVLASPPEEADRRSCRDFSARGLYIAYFIDPPASRGALACQPILLSAQLNTVDSRDASREFDLWGRDPLGISHKSSLSCGSDCGYDSADTSRATAAGSGGGGIPAGAVNRYARVRTKQCTFIPQSWT